MKRIHLLRPGTFTSNDGSRFTFAASDLAAIAAGYDPKLGEAPLTVGHPKTDHPAFGWVDRLEFDAGSGNLYAVPKQVAPEFSAAVNRGAFKKISVALFGPKQPANPKPGAYYIRHVGFLGAHVPAVPGLTGVEFAATEAPEVAIEFSAPGAFTVARLFRGLREWIIGESGVETADRVIPDYYVGELEAVARLPDDDASELAQQSESMAPAFADGAPKGPGHDSAQRVLQRLQASGFSLDGFSTALAGLSFAASAPKGQAGDGTGAAARRELKRLQDGGMSYGDISAALAALDGDVERSESTLTSIANDVIHNLPESLVTALRGIKVPASADLSATEQSRMTTIDQAALDARAAELDAREAAIKTKETEQAAQFAATAAQQRRLAIETSIDVAVQAGRVLPRERGLMVELAARINDGETVEFAAADGSTETVNLFERWNQFLGQLPVRVDTGEHAAPAAEAGRTSATFAAPAGYRIDSDRLELHNKALAYQAAHPGASYEQAVAIAEAS